MNNAEPPAAVAILASGSKTRLDMLAAAGLPLEAVPSDVDETSIKRALALEQASPETLAQRLAELKALQVSQLRPGALVIGADLVLVCAGRLFDKAADLDEARANLRAMAGRSHELICAAAVACDSEVIWQHSERPRLTMRQLDEADIERYLAQAGEAILSSVGGYHLEGRGSQLFDRVEGDFFSILGLPLLPLLAFLRRHDIVPG